MAFLNAFCMFIMFFIVLNPHFSSLKTSIVVSGFNLSSLYFYVFVCFCLLNVVRFQTRGNMYSGVGQPLVKVGG